jgi:hypothetical protein
MPIVCICEICQRAFTVDPYVVREGRGKYCSTKCYHQSTIKPLPERFWSYVLKTEDCWLWQGGRSPTGYGVFSLNSTKQIRAHRMAFELTFGLILPGLLCLHRCDQPPCVRPDHLFLGTSKDNTSDMFSKGRNGLATHPESFMGERRVPRNIPRGERSSAAKLTAEQVQAIRALYATGEWYQRDIAATFGVGQTEVHRIIHRQVWQHVD